MTEFGRLHFRTYLRVRTALLALALLVALLVEWLAPAPLLVLVALGIAADLILSLLAPNFTVRFTPQQILSGLLLLDTGIIALGIIYSGGLRGGFATLYVAIVLTALLLLGRRAALQFALLCIAAFAAQFVLELTGFATERAPLPVEFFGQFLLLAGLVALALVLASANRGMLAQMREEKSQAEQERAQAQHTQQRWALVNKVALRIQESTTPEQLYASIGGELEQIGLHCALLEWVEPNNSLRVIYLSLARPMVQEIHDQFPLGEGPLQLNLDDKPELTQAVHARAPLLLNANVVTQALFPALSHEMITQFLTQYEIVRVIFAPMVGESVRGVLGVFGKTLDENDLAPFGALAQQVASALEKARLLALEQKRAAQMALVGEIAARAAAFYDPDEILRAMVQLVQERFGYHHVCVSLYDAARQELEMRAVAGVNAPFYKIGERWKAHGGLIALAAQTRQTIISGDIHQDPRWIPDADSEKAGANSELCVPLVSGITVLGVLDVESTAFHAFDANDTAAMETLANQMAAALEKARSLQTEQRRAAQLALVNRIASRTARLISPSQLLREAVEMIHAQFGYFNVSVFMHNEESAGVRLVANAGALDGLATPQETVLTEGIIAYVGTSGNTYLCTDTRNDPRYLSPFPTRDQDPVEWEIAIPLRRGESVIGVLDIQSPHETPLSPNDIPALEALADQLAAALENARLFESEAQRVAELDAVRVLALKITAERDLDSLLHSIVSSAAQLVNAEGAALYIMDETRGDLVVRISRNLARDYVDYRLRIGEGMAGRVAETGEPMIIPNYSTWEGRSAQYEGEPLGQMLGVPLKWQERVLGVINLHRPIGQALFNEEELHLANLFAAQAAIALENARLLNAVETRLHAQHTLSEISGALLKTTDPQEIIDQAAAAALRALESETAIVFLPDEDGHLVAHAHAGIVPEAMLRVRIPADASSIPGQAYSLRRPALWSDNDPSSLAHVYPLAHRVGFRAGISVPMLVGERIAGVVTVNTHYDRIYNATDVQTLSLLANQTASALERARYFEELQRRVRELNLLFESYSATASTLDPDQVIARLLEQLVRSLNLTSAFFVHVDVEQGDVVQTHEYYSEAAHLVERTVHSRVIKIANLPEIQNVIAQNVQLVNASDAHLSAEMRAYMQENQVHTILRVPVVAAEEMLGYLSLWETRAPRAWSVEEIRFAQTMASQAAAALQNAQLYQAAQTRTRELQALYEASRLLNASLDVRTICENSVDSLRDILGYHHVGIYFIENDVLRLQVERGYTMVLDNIPRDRGVMARAMNIRQIIFLPDVSQEPAFLAALPEVQSEIAAPLVLGDRVYGVLNVETIRNETREPRKERLTSSDVQLVSTFANQLVVAIENARLFQETQQRLAEVRTLHAASEAVNANLKIEAVLERVAHEFLAALDVSSCTINAWDHDTNEIVILFDYDPEPDAKVQVGERFPLNAVPDMRELLFEGKTRALRQDELTPDTAGYQYLEKYLWKSVLVVTLKGKGRVTGFIELGDRQRLRTFNADEIRLAESLASQAAVSLENARLYRDAEQRLQETETLYGFARELGGMLNIQELGKRALDAAARLTDFDFGEVGLIREVDGAIVPLVVAGDTDLLPPLFAVPRSVGIVGWVADRGIPVRVGDVRSDSRYESLSSQIQSEICLPLRVGERVIGVLNLESKSPDAFNEHVEQLLTVFANQLAIAIENARLYEQTKRDAEVKAALLRELSHRVKNNLAAITSLLYMALDEPPDTREKILNETLGRVQSMAIAHALLARSSEARVSLLELGRQVLNDTIHNLAHPGIAIEILVEGDRVQVAARQTTTLALVLNELVTNALRHGFNGGKSDALMLRFAVAQLDQEVQFQLQDNGKGLPDDFDIQTSAGLGLNLVRTLVEKDLHGRFGLERRAQWTCADIRFRLEEGIV